MTPDPDAQHKESSVNDKRFFSISNLLMHVVTITKPKSDIAKCIKLLVKQRFSTLNSKRRIKSHLPFAGIILGNCCWLTVCIVVVDLCVLLSYVYLLPSRLKFSSNQFHVLFTCKITTATG